MKLIGYAFCIAALFAIGAAAQTNQIQHESQVKVKGGKAVTVVGCVERTADGGYLLTDVSPDGVSYVLAGGHDLDKHVGHRVEIRGKAADRGKAKVEVKDKTEGTSGIKGHETKTTVEGDHLDVPVLGIRSLKMLDEACR